MDWIFNHLQFVVLVVFAFASWYKHRMDTKAEEKEMAERQRRQAEEAEDDDPPFDDWKPEFQLPVPPPIPPPPVPLLVPSKKDESAAILQRQAELQERLRLAKENKAKTSGGAAATRLRVAAAQTGAAMPETAARSRLRDSLRQRKTLRRAIVTREILGPPMALRAPR